MSWITITGRAVMSGINKAKQVIQNRLNRQRQKQENTPTEKVSSESKKSKTNTKSTTNNAEQKAKQDFTKGKQQTQGLNRQAKKQLDQTIKEIKKQPGMSQKGKHVDKAPTAPSPTPNLKPSTSGDGIPPPNTAKWTRGRSRGKSKGKGRSL